MDFMMAKTSTLCCRWARMAMATPIAPSTMATRQIRLSRPVERLSPSVRAGLLSRKIGNLGIGQHLLQTSTHRWRCSAGGFSLKRKRSPERLPGCKRPLFEGALLIMTRGPRPCRELMRSGSRTRMAAMRKVESPI